MEQSTGKKSPIKAIFWVLFKLILGLLGLSIITLGILWGTWFFNRGTSSDYLPSKAVVAAHIPSLGKLYQETLDSRIVQRILGGLRLQGAYTASLELGASLASAPPWTRDLLDMPLDVASLDDGNIVLVVDPGWRSMFLQLAPFLAGFISIEGLTIGKTQVDGLGVISIAPQGSEGKPWLLALDRGQLIISQSPQVLTAAMEARDSESKRYIIPREAQSARLSFNPLLEASYRAGSLVEKLGDQGPLMKELIKGLSPSANGILGFGLTKDGLTLETILPYIQKASSLTSLFRTRGPWRVFETLPDSTSLAAGVRISSWKDAYLELRATMGTTLPSLEDLDLVSKVALGLDSKGLIFDWFGPEAVVAMVNNREEPVLALSVSNEGALDRMIRALGQSLFTDVTEAVAVGDSRISRIKVPGIWKSLAGIFGVELELPYFARVRGSFLLSENPWALVDWLKPRDENSEVAGAFRSKTLAEQEDAHVILYFDNTRFRPRLIQDIPVLGPIVGSFKQGLGSIQIQDSLIRLGLSMEGSSQAKAQELPGFPVALEETPLRRNAGSPHKIVLADVTGGANPELLYPSTQGNAVVARLDGTVVRAWAMDQKPWVLPYGKGKSLVALGDDGTLSRLDLEAKDETLELVKTGIRSVRVPQPWEGAWLSWDDDASQLVTIHSDLSTSALSPSLPSPVFHTVYTLGNNVLVYPRNLDGTFYTLGPSGEGEIIQTWVGGRVSAGGPVVFAGETRVAWVREGGQLVIWDPRQPETPRGEWSLGSGVKVPPLAMGNSLVILDQDGTIQLRDANGNELGRRTINALRGNDLWLRTYNRQGKRLISAGNGNLVWTFDENLAMIPGYPLPGGPVWYHDLDGDGTPELVSVDLEGNIHAHQLPPGQ